MAPSCVSKRRSAHVLQSGTRVLCTDFIGKNLTEPTYDVMEARHCLVKVRRRCATYNTLRFVALHNHFPPGSN